MQRASVVTLMILLGCGAAHAQSATAMPGIAATSPFGMLGSSPATGTGVPLGATEINPGGLSPATSCVSTDPSILGGTSTTSGSSAMSGMSGTSPVTSGSTFDGGGVANADALASTCASITPTMPNVTTTGIASPLSTAAPNLAGGTIPLGATALDGGGLSPLVAVPQPVMPTPGTTCTGSLSIGSDPTTMSLNPGTTLGAVPGC